LEHFFHKPSEVYTFSLPVPLSIRRKLVVLYYGFDEAVVRELLGKKLSHRQRKELDDVSAKTKVPIGSCRRQFDNLKRIMRYIENLKDIGASIGNSDGAAPAVNSSSGGAVTSGGLCADLTQIIQDQFMVGEWLAKLYAHVIFLNLNRIDTSRKKLLQYTFSDFEFCASVLMKYWAPAAINGFEFFCEFDSYWLQDLKELKQSVFASKDLIDHYRNLTYEHLLQSGITSSSVIMNPSTSSFTFSFFSSNIPTSTAITYMSSGSFGGASVTSKDIGIAGNSSFNDGIASSSSSVQNEIVISKDFTVVFKLLVRNMLKIGNGLAKPKETRNLFGNIVEKIIEPAVSCGWRGSDFDCFCNALILSWDKVNLSGLSNIDVDRIPRYQQSWRRLIIGIQLASLRMINDLSVAINSISRNQ
jgi:hypothetical protein